MERELTVGNEYYYLNEICRVISTFGSECVIEFENYCDECSTDPITYTRVIVPAREIKDKPITREVGFIELSNELNAHRNKVKREIEEERIKALRDLREETSRLNKEIEMAKNRCKKYSQVNLLIDLLEEGNSGYIVLPNFKIVDASGGFYNDCVKFEIKITKEGLGIRGNLKRKNKWSAEEVVIFENKNEAIEHVRKDLNAQSSFICRHYNDDSFIECENNITELGDQELNNIFFKIKKARIERRISNREKNIKHYKEELKREVNAKDTLETRRKEIEALINEYKENTNEQ